LIPASVFHGIIVANPILLFFFFLVKGKKITNPFIGCAAIELWVHYSFSLLILSVNPWLDCKFLAVVGILANDITLFVI
jgi:hypothetical protein